MERRTRKHDGQPPAGGITVATTPYFLSFDMPAERAPRWRCVSPIESDGSGLPAIPVGSVTETSSAVFAPLSMQIRSDDSARHAISRD